MQNCNLLCAWPCDTIEVWKRGERYKPEQLIDMFNNYGWLPKLNSGRANLVITGGEPLLQQNSLVGFLERLEGNIFVEVETNATIMPIQSFDKYISQYNVSPKLSNSKMSLNKRYIPRTIEFFSNKQNADFKFVIDNEHDVKEVITDFVKRYSIPNTRVYLMPVSITKEELERNSPKVIEYCKEYGFRYSPRLQLSIWDKATGL